MLQRFKINLDLMEGMNYFWQATSEKEKVSEKYLNDLAELAGFTFAYDDEFNAESVRKVLSSITNREPFSSKVKKEGRFWNNNMWMIEDLSYTDSIMKPLKKLNLDVLVEKLKSKVELEEIQVTFVPLHFDTFILKDNMLIINFFKVIPNAEGNLMIEDKPLIDFIEEKLAN